jgi:hypothetical protein
MVTPPIETNALGLARGLITPSTQLQIGTKLSMYY